MDIPSPLRWDYPHHSPVDVRKFQGVPDQRCRSPGVPGPRPATSRGRSRIWKSHLDRHNFCCQLFKNWLRLRWVDSINSSYINIISIYSSKQIEGFVVSNIFRLELFSPCASPSIGPQHKTALAPPTCFRDKLTRGLPRKPTQKIYEWWIFHINVNLIYWRVPIMWRRKTKTRETNEPECKHEPECKEVKPFVKQIISTVLYMFPLLLYQRGRWSVEWGGVQTAECKDNEDSRVLSGDCNV